MDVDPAASMRCWAIELDLGGRVFDIPALPAADWWPVFASADLTKILDMIESTPGADLDEFLMDNILDSDEMRQSLTDAAEQVSGRSLHVTLILVQVAAMHWAAINGDLARHGFRWDEQPFGAALDAIYLRIMNSFSDQKAQDKFTALLENEALTGGGRNEQAREKALDDFAAMAGPKPTAGVKSTGAPSEGARPKTQPRPRQLPPAVQSRVPRRPRGRRAESDPPASS
jgi:hypothetical protein